MIDGWGVPGKDSPKDGDAITNAKSPVMDGFAEAKDLYTQLEASSTAVGLPEGLMGNSEVGHLNIGAGRVVYQDVVRIGKFLLLPWSPDGNLHASHRRDYQEGRTGKERDNCQDFQEGH